MVSTPKHKTAGEANIVSSPTYVRYFQTKSQGMSALWANPGLIRRGEIVRHGLGDLT